MMVLSTLESDRVSLRPPEGADSAPDAALMAGPPARQISGPQNAQAAWRFFTHDAAAAQVSGFGCDGHGLATEPAAAGLPQRVATTGGAGFVCTVAAANRASADMATRMRGHLDPRGGTAKRWPAQVSYHHRSEVPS